MKEDEDDEDASAEVAVAFEEPLRRKHTVVEVPQPARSKFKSGERQ